MGVLQLQAFGPARDGLPLLRPYSPVLTGCDVVACIVSLKSGPVGVGVMINGEIVEAVHGKGWACLERRPLLPGEAIVAVEAKPPAFALVAANVPLYKLLLQLQQRLAIRVLDTGEVYTPVSNPERFRLEETPWGVQARFEDGTDFDYNDLAVEVAPMLALLPPPFSLPAVEVRVWSFNHAYSHVVMLGGIEVAKTRPTTRPRLAGRTLATIDLQPLRSIPPRGKLARQKPFVLK